MTAQVAVQLLTVALTVGGVFVCAVQAVRAALVLVRPTRRIRW